MTKPMLTRSPRLQPGMVFLRRVTRRPLRNRLQQRLLQATHLRLAKALPRQRSRALPPLEEMLAMRELMAKRLPRAGHRLSRRLLRLLRNLHKRPRPRTTSSKVSPIF